MPNNEHKRKFQFIFITDEHNNILYITSEKAKTKNYVFIECIMMLAFF